MGKHSDISQQAQYSKIMDVAGRLKVASAEDIDTAWNRLALKPSKQVFFHPYLKLAASVALVIVTLLTTYSVTQVEVLSARGEHKTVSLPDDSQIKLNAESSLSYNKLLWLFDRNVVFEGEGFFEVTKGSRFTVSTDNGNVEVLGTSFNVYTRSDKFEVACVTGKVKVYNTNNSVILTPGNTTSRQNDHLSTPVTFDKNITAWQYGEFYFDNAKLSDVVAEIERQYNIDIELDVERERFYTGFFQNNDIDVALKMVCIPLGLKYDTRSSKNIIISTNEIFN